MNTTNLITAFTLTSLITISQHSLGEQNSSAKQTSQNATSIPAVKISKDKDISATDFKRDERHEREFKGAFLNDIQFPSDDPHINQRTDTHLLHQHQHKKFSQVSPSRK